MIVDSKKDEKRKGVINSESGLNALKLMAEHYGKIQYDLLFILILKRSNSTLLRKSLRQQDKNGFYLRENTYWMELMA
jgi:hypothetical protein